MTITTPITELFGIQHPVLLAGMNVAAGPKLAAAVSNAGGLGVIGGVGYTPKHLRSVIKEIKEGLNKPDLPFGVDLLLPQVGGSARKTNYDYTKGQLDELIDVIIEEKAKLFVCAVGVPPKHVVDKLHKHGILVMNMIGHPKHADKALAQGVDIICAQGGEGGGHTGSIPTSILIPAVVDRVKGKTSPLMWGAQAVWVGTRFVASTEAGAPKKHKELVLSAGHGDTNTTLIYTGRPLRVRRTDYVKQWEERQDEIKALTSQGKLPHEVELSKKPELSLPGRPWLMGDVASVINDIKPAKEIIDEMVTTAEQQIKRGQALLTGAKL
jgi:NAD(P)H-dependent flavin oxidoreductase YrpB (nitropropane dioxygenase family)